MKTPNTYTKIFFANYILINDSVKTALYITVKNLRGECKKTIEGIRGAAEHLSYFPLR